MYLMVYEKARRQMFRLAAAARSGVVIATYCITTQSYIHEARLQHLHRMNGTD
ncbi:hypothetical protein BAUCODRAFT_118953 [Baudoinia panamericana UAMH 10762]|uniref:Uncharacterized protein n=1 Tax=Baudoinia panamericana (strain UAMH 10762) TaxID=717646 RepID=M2NAJ5_BAUPA|nr:uncharacterized protein BAUCODRAFT_118953 [Baudoinia panamericana UAMH 10762]EMD01249.1 hypothetical protein BAUCODRAFT_118953 [Baudoinia panamericana UAMH 10762]